MASATNHHGLRFDPTLPENQLVLLLNALPKFIHLIVVEFAEEAVPLFLERKFLMAFKRNGIFIQSITTCPMTDYQNKSDKLTAYHNRNKYLPMSFESAIENKTTAKDDHGPGEFLFPLVYKSLAVDDRRDGRVARTYSGGCCVEALQRSDRTT
jgi:hypothetical protein